MNNLDRDTRLWTKYVGQVLFSVSIVKTVILFCEQNMLAEFSALWTKCIVFLSLWDEEHECVSDCEQAYGKRFFLFTMNQWTGSLDTKACATLNASHSVNYSWDKDNEPSFFLREEVYGVRISKMMWTDRYCHAWTVFDGQIRIRRWRGCLWSQEERQQPRLHTSVKNKSEQNLRWYVILYPILVLSPGTANHCWRVHFMLLMTTCLFPGTHCT